MCFSNNNVIFDVLSHVLSINQSRELFYRYSGDTETIRVVPFVNSNIHDVTGGEVNFLSRELYITVSNSIKDPSSQYFDFSDASLDAVNDPVSYNLSAVVVSDRGAVSILDKDDFDNAFSDDLIDNGTEIVSIKASHDAAYFLPHQVENAGYTVRAIYNREGKFSLHASDFEILAENNAITPYGTMKDTKLSSTVVGVFGQGGQFSFRSGPKGGRISSESLEDAFNDEFVGVKHKTESFGVLLLSQYNPIVDRDENGEYKPQSKEMLGIDVKGSHLDFLQGNGSRYVISSLSKKDASYGIFVNGTNNIVNFYGDTLINSRSFGQGYEESSIIGGDGDAYGIVNMSCLTNVAGVVEKQSSPYNIIYKLTPKTYFDSGSRIFLEDGSKLKLTVNSQSGNAFGLLQVGESASVLNGSVEIEINNSLEKGDYLDSYAIFAIGDDRKSEFSSLSETRSISVSSDLAIFVNDGQKIKSLKKARAIEAKGRSLINVNVENGGGFVDINGDLHTAKDVFPLDDSEINVPNANYLSVGINVLAWAVHKQDEELYGRSAKKRKKESDSSVLNNEISPTYQGEGRINFVMNQKDSRLVGAANGSIDMEVGSGTLWSVTDDSIFENLRPTGGTIDLHHAEEKWNEANPYQYLMVKNITDEAYPLESGTRTAAPAENSLFILNTNIMGDLEKDGKRVFSFDGITYYEKADDDGEITNGTLTGETFTGNGSYIFNGQPVPIELKGFTVTEAAARMRHDIRFGDFLDFRTETSEAQEPREQHYRVRINDETIADGSIDYRGRVLKFATTPAHVKLSGDWTSLDYTAFKYKPKIWKTEHTDQYVKADGTLDTRPGSVLNEEGVIQEAVNSTLFERDDYDKVVEGLESTESDPDALDIATGMTDYWVSGYTKEINDPGKTTTAIAGISFNPIYLSTLRKRLGEVRYGAQDGLWAKAMMMKDSVGGIASKGYDQDLYGVSFGYDHLVRNTEEGLWLLGANIRQAHAEQDLMDGLGSGKTDAIGLNAYATWANYQGAYADFVLSADHYRQKLSTVGEKGKITGKYNTLGWGASIEVGHMFHTTRNDLSWGPWYNSWWLEPQLQLAFYRVEGEKYTLSSGGRIRQKDADSLIGRAGIVIGKKFNYGEDREEIDRRYSQVYLKAGVKHDFLGDRTVWFGSDRFDGEVAGKTTFYYGLGGDWQFNERMRLYGQIERETGDDYEKDYEVSVGLKYEF